MSRRDPKVFGAQHNVGRLRAANETECGTFVLLVLWGDGTRRRIETQKEPRCAWCGRVIKRRLVFGDGPQEDPTIFCMAACRTAKRDAPPLRPIEHSQRSYLPAHKRRKYGLGPEPSREHFTVDFGNKQVGGYWRDGVAKDCAVCGRFLAGLHWIPAAGTKSEPILFCCAVCKQNYPK